MSDKEYIIGIFSELGRLLAGFGRDETSEKVIVRAAADNCWFTRKDIMRSIEAIRRQMLDRDALVQWLDRYPALPANTSKNVGVIMPGNIPLVGFFDMLCVLASGHRCYYKVSSKDTALIEYMVGALRGIWSQVPIYNYIGQPLDAVIATGSDNTNRYFRSRFRDIPSVFRGSRASVAVLDDEQTPEQLAGLADDIFSYSGLGCRNVSHLLVPNGYDIRGLIRVFNNYGEHSPKFHNNFVQRRAILAMHNAEFMEGDFFILRLNDDFPVDISEITFQHYTDPSEAEQWLSAHDCEIQCVAGMLTKHPRGVALGQTQSPSLTEYPDGKDTMLFLSGI